jgi:hypothetical protein
VEVPEPRQSPPFVEVGLLARLIAAPAGELEVNVAERARCRPEVDAAELASELAVVGVAVANRDLASAFDEAGVSTGLGLWHGRDAGGDGDEGDREEEALLLREMILADFRIAEFGAKHSSLEDVFLQVTKGWVQ